MIISPFYALFFLYVAANCTAMIFAILDGGMMLEGQFFYLNSESLIYAFVLQFCILLFLAMALKKCMAKNVMKKIQLGNFAGIFLIVVQVSFIIFNLAMGVNTAGSAERIEGGSLVNYIFILLQPDILFLLIGISMLSVRLFLVSVMIFLVSMVLRGWMSGFFIIFFMLLARYYPVRISARNAFAFIFLALMFFLILPIIIDVKWAMRSGVSFGDFFSDVFDSFSFEKYSYSFEYLLSRFQHVGHVALLLENSDKVFADLQGGVFVSYWMDGLPQYTIAKLLGLETYKLNSYMVEYFFGIPNPTWNTNPGIAGWLFVLQEQFIFMILYLFLTVMVPFYLIGKYAGNAMLMLVACFSITYLFHGWNGAYFNIVFYALLLIFVCKVRFNNRRIAWSSANKVVS